MILSNKNFLVLTCLYLTGQNSSLNAKFSKTRTENAAIAVHCLLSMAVARQQDNQLLKGLIVGVKDAACAQASSRGQTLANSLSKWLKPEEKPTSKKAKTLNFFKNYLKEALGSDCNDLLGTIFVEDIIRYNIRNHKFMRGISLDALNNIAYSECENPLNQAFFTEILVHALANSPRAKEHKLLHDYNRLVRKRTPLLELFLKSFSCKQKGREVEIQCKRILKKMLTKWLIKACELDTGKEFVFLPRLINHLSASFIKTAADYVPVKQLGFNIE